MREAYDLASRRFQSSAKRGKKQYDRSANSFALQPGGAGKLIPYWEGIAHQVVKRKGEESPVYEIIPETGERRRRVVHQNLLLPCNDLPFEVQQGR